MKVDEVLDRLPQGIFTLRERVAQVLGIITNPPPTAAQEGEPPTDLVAENKRLRDRLLTLEAVARNVVSDLAKERRLVYEDFDDGAIESAAKDTTETSAIELAKVLGGDTIPEWALNPIAIELPFETLEKMHQLLVDPPRPSERLRAAARRVREDRLAQRSASESADEIGEEGGEGEGLAAKNGGRFSAKILQEIGSLACHMVFVVKEEYNNDSELLAAFINRQQSMIAATILMQVAIRTFERILVEGIQNGTVNGKSAESARKYFGTLRYVKECDDDLYVPANIHVDGDGMASFYGLVSRIEPPQRNRLTESMDIASNQQSPNDRLDKRNTNGGMGKMVGGGRLSLCSLCEGACLSCDECRSTNLSIALCEFWRDGFKFHHGGGWVQRKRSTESIFEARNFVRGLHEPGERGWWNRQALRMRLMGSIVPSEQALGCQPANAEFGALLTQLLRVDNVPPFLKQAPSTDAERSGG